MSDPSLVFKLYGDFLWPPKPTEDEKAERRRVCVEIHYAQASDTDKTYRAYLIWKPFGAQSRDPGKPNDGSHSLYSLPNPVEWFAQEQNANQSIWIYEPTVKSEKPVVTFRGAFLFEQYSLDDGKRELRWPLIPEYKTVYSALILKGGSRKTGSTLQPHFDFDLSLPLPVKHADDNKWAAFPLRAVYYPQAKTLAEIGQVNELFGRGFKRGKEVRFQFNTLPVNLRLGRFDLAASGKGKPPPDCVIYDPQKGKDPLGVYWPARKSIAEDLLNTAGLSQSFKGTDPVPVTPADAHLRFVAPDNGEDCILAYRTWAAAGKVILGALREIEPPLVLNPTVHIDVYLKWRIPDQEVWTPEAWKPRIEFRLIWSEKFQKNDFSVTPPPTFFARRLLVDTAARANSTRAALPFIEGLQPTSILPELRVAKKSKVAFVLISEDLQGSCKEYFKSGATQKISFVSWGSHLPAHLRMTLADGLQQRPDLFKDVVPKENSLPLKATLPGFLLNGSEISLSLEPDESWAQREANSGAAGSPYFASFALKVTAISEDANRIGALAFKFPKPQSAFGIDPDFLRTAGRAIGGQQAFRYGTGKDHLNATMRLTLPVSQVTPLSTDVTRIDRTRRPVPLLIDMTGQDGSQNASAISDQINYYLRATETFGSDDDRLLTLSLLDNTQVQGERDYLLLAEEPYSVLRFRQTPLGARGNASNSEVALYSSDDHLWQYRIASPLYHFMLPPQAIGESADKPNRLELHDLHKLGDSPPHP